jgi:outer membrane protein OmpA-like peptidoglycan-associated protein
VRNGVIGVLLAIPAATAVAGPADRMEASGFLGVDYYGDEVGLGGAAAPEQRPQTAPTFGGRLTYIPLRVGRPDAHLDVGIEGELSFTPSWTGYGFDGPRPSVFAPVFGYHANLLLRIGGGWLQPHVTAGGGGETVVSSSQYMAKETDGIFQWGVGVSFPFDRWQLRFDARQGIVEAMNGGTTQTYEGHMSIGAVFGASRMARIETSPVVVVEPPPRPPEPDKDTDGDGIPDSLDVCPRQAESVNGIADQDGCPEPDNDSDGIVGAADKCPDRAEDVDKFEDDDGCPDDDNDKDGVADAKDACPNEAENKNGIADQDGCVDQIPDTFVKAFAAAGAIKFEKGRTRLDSKSKAALEKTLAVLLTNKALKVQITAATDAVSEPALELAKKRAEVVKWYLIDQGVAEGNIQTLVGGAVSDKKAPIISITIAQN